MRHGPGRRNIALKMQAINYFYQSSRHLADARLPVSGAGDVGELEVFSFLNGLDFDYRAVLTVECIDALADSSKNYLHGEYVHDRHDEVDLPPGVALANLIVHVDLPAQVKRGGRFALHVCACRYVPLIGLGCSKEEYEQRGVVYSEILFIHLIFCKATSITPQRPAHPFIYESYDQLGFVGIDEALFNDFIVERLGRGTHDLVHSFTTTEIANELFQAGLMILCWGITPWVYMINSIETHGTNRVYPEGLPVCQRGSYFLLEEISEISVVPGVALKEWNTEVKGAWPKLKLQGTGGDVNVDLCVAKAVNPYAASVPDYLPIPFFNLIRVDRSVTEPAPILAADIESCMW